MVNVSLSLCSHYRRSENNNLTQCLLYSHDPRNPCLVSISLRKKTCLCTDVCVFTLYMCHVCEHVCIRVCVWVHTIYNCMHLYVRLWIINFYILSGLCSSFINLFVKRHFFCLWFIILQLCKYFGLQFFRHLVFRQTVFNYLF